MKITQNIMAIVAILFGLLTIFAGTRVLLGANPGYLVFRPLLIYNTAMGVMYVAAGVVAWRNIKHGMYAAVTLFILNSIVLAAIIFLYTEGRLVAVDSLRAMSLRAAVWFVLFAGFWWLWCKDERNNSKSKL